jgi:hypothetical protein
VEFAHEANEQLGYSDPISPEEALRGTARWYIEHQPERDGDIERRVRL